MASGLTLIFGVMEIINIAQGILVILGAYLSYWLEQRFHIDLFVGLLITIPIMFLLGMVMEWAFIRRLKWERTTLVNPGDLCHRHYPRGGADLSLHGGPGDAPGLVY